MLKNLLVNSRASKFKPGWVKPWKVQNIEDCLFYHTVELPGHGVIDQGLGWDLRGRFSDYLGNIDVKGKTFLDVGAASGYISFEAEKQGAIVTSFDLDTGLRRQPVPKQSVGDLKSFLEQSEAMYKQIKNSYWLSHAALKSKAKVFYGNIYQFPDDFGPFDIVFLGQVLVHVRDPIGALINAASVCEDHLVITEGSFDSEQPLAVFLSAPESQNFDAWWHLSTKLYHDILEILGFEVVSITKHVYSDTHPHLAAQPVDIPTIVAKRVSPRERNRYFY